MVMPLFENTLDQMMERARLLCYDTIIPIASLDFRREFIRMCLG